jgi:hypothetical protein
VSEVFFQLIDLLKTNEVILIIIHKDRELLKIALHQQSACLVSGYGSDREKLYDLFVNVLM